MKTINFLKELLTLTKDIAKITFLLVPLAIPLGALVIYYKALTAISLENGMNSLPFLCAVIVGVAVIFLMMFTAEKIKDHLIESLYSNKH